MTPPLAPMRIGDRHVTTDDITLVVSPFDGHEVGRVPKKEET